MSESATAQPLYFGSERQYTALRTQLLDAEPVPERGAFLFAARDQNRGWQVVETAIFKPKDLVEQSAFCLELRDGVLQAMIVRAHKTGTALVEVHTHPFSVGTRVQFSWLDCMGLADIGPQLAWRLPGRPYIALVLGRTAFDSLYWEGVGRRPQGSVDLEVAGKRLHATGQSERFWRELHG